MTSPRSYLAVAACAAVALSILAPTAGADPVSTDAAAAQGAQGKGHRPTDPPTPAIPQRYLDQQIQWSVCSFDATVKSLYPAAPTTNCATVMVPMDWHNPDAHPDVRVAIAYSRATGTSRGLMSSNPGGPGGAGLTLSAALAIDKPQLFSDFDLLGFDPRGFGRSEPLRCLTTTEKLAALPTTPDYKERTAQTHRTEIAEARLFAEACDATEFGKFVSSQQTVYDMDFLRALLGHRQLNFIGYSYGTWLGGWYADTYPQHTGRLVLDSNMDWTHTQWDNVNFDPFSFQRRRDTMLLPWIARHADQITSPLGTTPQQVLREYDRVRAELVRLVKAGTSFVAPYNLDGNVASAIYGNTRFIRATLDILVHQEYVAAPSASGDVEAVHVERAWARLAPALQQYDSLAGTKSRYGVPATAAAASLLAASGADTDADTDASVKTLPGIIADARRAAAAPGARSTGDAVVNLGAVGTTVRCNDTEWVTDPRFYLREADRMTREYPFFGYLNGVPMCAFWPHEPLDRRLDMTGSPRLLMITSEIDPATAYEGALRTHEDTERYTRLVSIDDEGQHGQYVGSASACAEAIGDRFVFTGELPGRDEVCGTTPLPEDLVVYPVDGPVDGNAVPLPRGSRPRVVNPALQALLDEVARHALI
ncbi:MAG TPA: alpha/beta fold hydrolase [Pseudonocardiaceae bacterium]